MIKNRKIDYDYSSKMIVIDKKIIKLTPSENKVFYAITNKDKISYEELCEKVYNKKIDQCYKKGIITLVHKLRNKIEDVGDIYSVYGYGYRFKEKEK